MNKLEFTQALKEDPEFAKEVLGFLLPHLDLYIGVTTSSVYTMDGYKDVPDVEYSIGVKQYE